MTNPAQGIAEPLPLHARLRAAALRTARALHLHTARRLAVRGAERALHPLRRESARRRVRAAHASEILFVCQGNIYRSVYAGAVFSAAIPAARRAELRVGSAGFVGPGRESPTPAVELARRRGYDLRPHRSSLLTPERVRAADLVVVMSAAQRRRVCALGIPARRVVVLGDLDPGPIATREITDPWKQPFSVLLASYLRIEQCTAELARALGRR